MVDYAPELVSGLSAVLPTFAEPAEAGGTPLPCITYTETNRRDTAAVNGRQVSEIQIRVRVWAASRKDLAGYASGAEAALRRMGWGLIGGGELAANGRFCRVMTCQATGWDTQTW